MEVPYPASRSGAPNIDFLSPSVGVSALQGKMTVYGDESLAEAIAGPRLLRRSLLEMVLKNLYCLKNRKPYNYVLALTGHRKYNSRDLENDFTQTK